MTPACTVCGYAVEWLRSSYQSDWRLFRDRSGVLTPGRYVKLPLGSAHYPGVHNLWSRNWTTEEADLQPPLGEDYATRHVYDFGDAQADLPPKVIIGSADCIANGETAYPSDPPITLIGGWDSRCYLNVNPAAPTLVNPIDVRDCHWQHRIVAAINLIYTQDAAAAVAYLTPFLPGCTLTGFDNTPSVVPGCIIITKGTWTALLMAGTTTPQQWALQAMTGAAGAVNFGRYSTLLFWFQVSNLMLDRLARVAPMASGDLLFAGHSFGGALACILATRARENSPFRGIQLITYGCPKPGDARLIQFLDTCQQVHFVNTDDPVTFVPPSTQDLQSFGLLVPQAIADRWGVWQRPSALVGLDLFGNRRDSPLSPTVYQLLMRMVRQYIAGADIEVIAAHRTDEYARRIQCPAAPVPSPDPSLQPALWLQAASLESYSDFDSVGFWADSSLYGNNAIQDNPANTPVKQTLGLGVVAQFPAQVSSMGFSAISPAGDYCIFAVFTPALLAPLTDHGDVIKGQLGAVTCRVGVTGSNLVWVDSRNTKVHTAPFSFADLNLISVRRVGSQVTFRFNGTVYPAQAINPAGRSTWDTLARQPFDTPPGLSLQVAEVCFFDGTLTPSEESVWAQETMNRYGIT